MRRLSIVEFRARLAGRGPAGPLLHAYRELARRPELRGAAAGRCADWTIWADAAAHPRAAASVRFAEWNVWTSAAAPVRGA